MKKFVSWFRSIEIEWNLFVPSIIWVVIMFVPVVKINEYLLPQQPTEAGNMMNLLFLAGFMACFMFSMFPIAGLSVVLIILLQSDINWKERAKTIAVWLVSWMPCGALVTVMHVVFK